MPEEIKQEWFRAPFSGLIYLQSDRKLDTSELEFANFSYYDGLTIGEIAKKLKCRFRMPVNFKSPGSWLEIE